MAITSRRYIKVDDLDPACFGCAPTGLQPIDQGGLTYNATTGVLTHTSSKGTQVDINLPLENFLSSAVYDAPSNVLTLTLDDGTTFPVDLSDLVDTVVLQVADTSCIDLTLTGDGSTATPWEISATPIIDPNANNVLSCGPAGLLVDWCDVFDSLDTGFPTLDCAGLPILP